MSLQARARYRIPKPTARVAKAAFPNGNLYLQMADALGLFYKDEDFAALCPPSGQPAFSPARLAMATALQFAEGLADRHATDAVRLDRAFLRKMLEQKSGVIIHVSSIQRTLPLYDATLALPQPKRR